MKLFLIITLWFLRMHNASSKCYVMNEAEEETGFYSNGMIENISFLFNEKISVIRRIFWGVLISVATFYSVSFFFFCSLNVIFLRFLL